MHDILPGREIIFEVLPMGAILRINAMDVVTAVEITIQAPLGTAEIIWQRNAAKRLAYVLRKKGLIE
jgi:hypothetical protein